jgi:hypothetical protein
MKIGPNIIEVKVVDQQLQKRIKRVIQRSHLLLFFFVLTATFIQTLEAAYQRVWRDEFDSFDTARWGKYDGPNSNGNQNRKASHATVSNSKLILRAEMINGTLYTAGVKCIVNYRHPKFVVSVKTGADPYRSSGYGVLSGVVMTRPAGGAYPREYDFYETGPNGAASRPTFKSNIHYSKPESLSNNQHDQKTWPPDGVGYAGYCYNFHTVHCFSKSGEVQVKVDGSIWWKAPNASNNTVDYDRYVIMQYDDKRIGTTVSGSGVSTMEIDWVECWVDPDLACLENPTFDDGQGIQIVSKPENTSIFGTGTEKLDLLARSLAGMSPDRLCTSSAKDPEIPFTVIFQNEGAYYTIN